MQKQEKKGLKDLGAMKGQVAAAKFRLPTLGNLPVLMSNAEAAELRQEVGVLVKQICEAAKDIGKALGDEDSLDVRMGDILEKESTLVSAITAEGTDPGVRRTLGESYIKALTESVPRNQDGLNHIADQGLAVGVAYLTPENGKGVKLPVTPKGGGRWNWTYVSFPPGAIYSLVRDIASEVSNARNERLEAEKEVVEKGAGKLLEVLATGTGEAAFYVPDKYVEEKGEKRVYGGGTVRALFKDGLIYPLEAAGKCRVVVERAVKTHQGLPISSLEDGQLRFKEKLPREEFSALRIFMALCIRGLEFAKEGQRRYHAVEATRAKTTVSATSLVVHNRSGLTYLFLKGWVAMDKDGKNWDGSVGILVERSAEGIRLAESIEKCRRLFSDDCYEFHAPGDKFTSLPAELGSIMRKLYGILARTEERNDQPVAAV